MIRAVLAFSLVLFVSAVGGAEEASAVIVSAVYGDFGKDGAKVDSAKTVDVTQKVAGAVRVGKVSLEVTNELFGDPAEQASKTLKVKFKIGSVESEVSVVEGETLLIPVPKLEGALVIHKAVYGDIAGDAVNDVTQDLKGRLKDNGVEIEVSNDQFGDPASGVFKRLRVEYSIGIVRLTSRRMRGRRSRSSGRSWLTRNDSVIHSSFCRPSSVSLHLPGRASALLGLFNL